MSVPSPDAKVLALHVERVVLPLDRLAFQRRETADSEPTTDEAVRK